MLLLHNILNADVVHAILPDGFVVPKAWASAPKVTPSLLDPHGSFPYKDLRRHPATATVGDGGACSAKKTASKHPCGLAVPVGSSPVPSKKSCQTGGCVMCVWAFAVALCRFLKMVRTVVYAAALGVLLGSIVVHGNGAAPAFTGDQCVPCGQSGVKASYCQVPNVEWRLVLLSWGLQSRRRPCVMWHGTRRPGEMMPTRAAIVHAALCLLLRAGCAFALVVFGAVAVNGHRGVCATDCLGELGLGV